MASPVLLRTDISIQSDIKRTERVKNPVDKDGTFSTGKDGSLITFPAEYIFKDLNRFGKDYIGRSPG